MNIQEELVLNVIERLTKIHEIQKLFMLSSIKLIFIEPT